MKQIQFLHGHVSWLATERYLDCEENLEASKTIASVTFFSTSLHSGAWAVSARIVPAGATDCVYMITLVKPPKMPEEAFRQGMLVEEELQAMRCILAQQ